MDELSALLIGIIQGLTEFLPISSSGHIELAKVLLNANIEEGSMLFTVVLHLGTALSTIVLLRKDIVEILTSVFKKEDKENRTWLFALACSMIPAVIVGVCWEDLIEHFSKGNILLVGICLLITGGLLFYAQKSSPKTRDISIKNGFLIGVFQAIALLPGISRSGATISGSVLLGVDKSKAARFSFLMVLPLIFGKVLKDIFTSSIGLGDAPFSCYLIGFLAAFLVGLLACKWMIKLVKTFSLNYFIYYCFFIGVVAIAWHMIH